MPRKTIYPRAFTVRLTDAQGSRVDELAEEDGRSPAEWIRERIRRALHAEDKRRQRAAD